jgi:hypothetical protein
MSGYPGVGTTDQNKSAPSLELVVLVTPHLLRTSHPGSSGVMQLLPVH